MSVKVFKRGHVVLKVDESKPKRLAELEEDPAYKDITAAYLAKEEELRKKEEELAKKRAADAAKNKDKPEV